MQARICFGNCVRSFSTHQLGFLIGRELKQYRQLEEDLGDIQARFFWKLHALIFFTHQLGSLSGGEL